MKIIYGQYSSRDYPLKQYSFNDIPSHIRDVLKNLSDKKLAICRGGMAYILLTGDNSYLLKDIDMLAKESDAGNIFKFLFNADVVYVNKNKFNNDVITAFWKDDLDYYKLDILLQKNKINYIKINNDVFDRVVPASYIWRDRIKKISENDIRGHSAEKTLRHFYVAYNISVFLQKHISLIDEYDKKVVASVLEKTYMSLEKMVDRDIMKKFIEVQNFLLRC